MHIMTAQWIACTEQKYELKQFYMPSYDKKLIDWYCCSSLPT